MTKTPLRQFDRAYNALKTAIMDGEYRPGEQIVVSKLTSPVRASRQPLMEALKRLENEGLVEIIPQVGCRVAQPLSIQEIRDFYDIFALVEAFVSKLSAARRTKQDVENLQLISLEMENLIGAPLGQKETAHAYRHHNRRFHHAVHLMARSKYAEKIAESMWDRSSFYIATLTNSLAFTERLEPAFAEHQQIVQSIADGDEQITYDIVKRHILAAGKATLMHMQESVFDEDSKTRHRSRAEEIVGEDPEAR